MNQKESDRQKLEQVAREVASALGWEFRLGKGRPPFAVSDGDRMISIDGNEHWDGWRGLKRYVIAGTQFPECRDGKSMRPGYKDPTISVDAGRDTFDVVNAITKRLLPEYDRLIAESKTRVEQREAAMEPLIDAIDRFQASDLKADKVVIYGRHGAEAVRNGVLLRVTADEGGLYIDLHKAGPETLDALVAHLLTLPAVSNTVEGDSENETL